SSFEDIFRFLTSGKDFARVIPSILSRLHKAFSYQERLLVDNIKSGKGLDVSEYGGIVKSSKFKVPKGFSSEAMSNLFSKFGSSIFKAISKITGPYGLILIVIVKIVQFLINRRQDQIQFNNNLLKAIGLNGQLADLSVSNQRSGDQYKKFFQNFYDYLNSKNKVNSITMPDGTVVNQSNNSIEFNMNLEKYNNLLNPLIQGGMTLLDIENEFGRVNLKGGKLGSERTDQVANLKKPLEDIFAIASVYQVDPSMLSRSLSSWKFSFGDLIQSNLDAVRQMHEVANASFTKPDKFLQNVIELSDSFSLYSNRSTALSKVLGDLVKNRIYGLDQAKKLISGAISDLIGLNTTQVLGIIGPMLRENPQSVVDLLQEGEDDIRKEIEITDQKINVESNEDKKQALLVRRQQLNALLLQTQSVKDSVKNNRTDEVMVTNTVTTIMRQFSEFSLKISERAVNSRLQLIDNQSIKQNPSLSDRVKLDYATRTMGNLGKGTLAYLMGKSYADNTGVGELPPPTPPETLEEIFTKTAVGVTQQTVSFMDSLDVFIESVLNKVYSTILKALSLAEKLWNAVIGKEETSDQSGTGFWSPPLAGLPIKDMSSEVAVNKQIDDLDKVNGIVITSSADDFNKTVDQSVKSVKPPNFHYAIDRNGDIVQVLGTGQKSSMQGSFSSESPLVKEGIAGKDEPLLDSMLGISLIEKAGSTASDFEPYTERQYQSLGSLVAKLMIERNLTIEQVFASIDSARSGGNTNTRLDLEKVKRIALQQYRDIRLSRISADSSSKISPEEVRKTLLKDTLVDSQSDKYFKIAFEKQRSFKDYENFKLTASTFFDSLDFENLKQLYGNTSEEGIKEFTKLAQNFSNKLGVDVDLSIFRSLVHSYIQFIESRYAREELSITKDQSESLKALIRSDNIVPYSIQRKMFEYKSLDESAREKISNIAFHSNIKKGGTVFVENNEVDVFISGSTLEFQNYLKSHYRNSIQVD
ncbi:hypothetical protein EBS02_03330, partial [bacterium]|nr:hypothetical protein [bacterium]